MALGTTDKGYSLAVLLSALMIFKRPKLDNCPLFLWKKDKYDQKSTLNPPNKRDGQPAAQQASVGRRPARSSRSPWTPFPTSPAGRGRGRPTTGSLSNGPWRASGPTSGSSRTGTPSRINDINGKGKMFPLLRKYLCLSLP